MSKTKTKKEALEDRLGRVLGRSWADLGPILGGLGAQNRAVAHTGLVFLKNQLLETMKLQEASWAHLGPNLGGFGWPKRVPEEAFWSASWRQEGAKKSGVKLSEVKVR